jgi:hypothetical protein
MLPSDRDGRACARGRPVGLTIADLRLPLRRFDRDNKSWVYNVYRRAAHAGFRNYPAFVSCSYIVDPIEGNESTAVRRSLAALPEKKSSSAVQSSRAG